MIATSGENLYYNFEAFHKNPIYKLEYYETPYGVPSLGYGVEYFNDSDNSGSITFSNANRVMKGKDNILAYDWGTGVPPGINARNYFKAKYYGYFYAKYSGTYRFYVTKNPNDYFRAYFDYFTPTTTGNLAEPSNFPTYILDEWSVDYRGLETRSFDVVLTEGEFRPFLFLFAQRDRGSYFSVRYREPNAVQNTDGEWSDYDTYPSGHYVAVEHRKVLSAGVANYNSYWNDYTEASFLSPITISGGLNVRFNQSINQSNILDFQVPIDHDTLVTSGVGYRFRRDIGLYYNDRLDAYLRHGRLIKYYFGYSSNDSSPIDSDYIQRFEGVITDIDVDRQANAINVKCQDILYKTIKKINENYPDQLSYAYFDFTEENAQDEPDGASRPVAYDAWPVKDAVRDLLIKAKIDPTKLYGRRKILDRDLNISYGDYLIEDKNIVLRRRTRYGNPFMIGDAPTADDTYIWSFNFGDYLFDLVSKFADAYGYIFEANNEGYVKFSSINTPTTYVPDVSWVLDGTWTSGFDLRSDSSSFLYATTDEAALTKEVYGSAFAINLIKEYQVDKISWDIKTNELPSGIPYQVNNPPYWFGVLYGRYPVIDPDYPEDPVAYSYLTTFNYINPTKTFTATAMTVTYRWDNPAFYGLEEGEPDNEDIFNVNATIEIGYIDPADPTTLITPTTVLSSYRRKPVPYPALSEKITFSTPKTIFAGNTYAIKVTTTITSGSAFGSSPDEFSERNITFSPRSMKVIYEGGNPSLHSAYFVKSYWVGTSTITTGNVVYDSGSNYAVFNDIELYGIEDSSTDVNLYKWTDGKGYDTLVWSGEFSNYYDGYNLTGRDWRYPSDGIDYNGINPCNHRIDGYYIGADTYGELKLPYGRYLIEVISNRSGTATGTRIASVDVYDDDAFNPKAIFSTSRNIIGQLQIGQSVDDVRNDVIVVGDLLGAARDFSTNQIINQNNPSFQYVYSRATDISSINDPDVVNNIGDKNPFIIFEPSIVDQRHCDWLAEAILYRYKAIKKIPNFSIYPLPTLEVNDCSFVLDYYNESFIADTDNTPFHWITDISESVNKGNYAMSVNTTPYSPWSSFVQREEPDINNFGGYPFINIKITDLSDTIRGMKDPDGNYVDGYEYDVYETESGNRFKITYDQVINGDIIVKVMTKNVNGFTGARNVAFLVGSFDPEKGEIPEYREWGVDYELQWDGIDQTGNSRRWLGQTNVSGDFISIGEDDFISSYTEPGFFAASGTYFIRFIIKPRNKSLNPVLSVDTDKLNPDYNTYMAGLLGRTDASTFEQLAYIKWGELSNIDMLVSGASPSYAGGSERNLFFYPNNYFDELENGANGILFKYLITGLDTGTTKTLYYKTKINHFWGLGYTFLLRITPSSSDQHPYKTGNQDLPRYSTDETENWKEAFIHCMNAKHMYDNGYTYERFSDQNDSLHRYIRYNNIINGGSFYSWPNRSDPNSQDSLSSDDWSAIGLLMTKDLSGSGDNIRKQLSEPYSSLYGHPEPTKAFNPDHNYTITWISSPYNRYRVVGWFNVPYTTYELDYLQERLHKYSNDNVVQFYFHPENPLAGGWIFDAIPDLTQQQYDMIRGYLGLAAYYAGPQDTENYRVELLTTHAFQVKTVIWDGTGRVLRSETQKISKGQVSNHEHGAWNITDDSSLTSHSHTDDNTIIFHPGKWGLANGLEFKNSFLDMTTLSGASYIPNYGIGYCNVSGMTNYGWHTWHGYWQHSQGSSFDYQIPVNLNSQLNNSINDSKHWFKYAESTDSYSERHFIFPHTGQTSGLAVVTATGNNGNVYNKEIKLKENDENGWTHGRFLTKGYLWELGYENGSVDVPTDTFYDMTLASSEMLTWLKTRHAHGRIYESVNGTPEQTGQIEYGVLDSAYAGQTWTDKYLRFQGEIFKVTLDRRIDSDNYYYAKFVLGVARLGFTPMLSPNGNNWDTMVLDTDPNFPKVWYKLTYTLPWSSVTTNNHYWMNFIATGSNPFELSYGGWSDRMKDIQGEG